MDDYKISDILFTALSKPNPVEYLAKEQRESRFSEFVFWRLLLDALVHYYNVIQRKISEYNNVGNGITDYHLALFTITNGKYSNHFGKRDVSILAETLKELARFYCLPEHVYFSAYPLHDTNLHIGYIESELEYLDYEFKIKFLSLHIVKAQTYIDAIIKNSVEHPSLKIEGERADRLSKARAFLEYLLNKKTTLINNPPAKPIIQEAKGGVAATNTLVASVSAAMRLFNAPPKYDEFCKHSPEFAKCYWEIDQILSEDNGGPFIFPSLIKKTQNLISIIPPGLRADFLESLKLQIPAFRIAKQGELKYDDSYYIDHTPKQMGIHTEQSRFVKASKESIEIKLNLLDEYEKWVMTELEQLKKMQPMTNYIGVNSAISLAKDRVLNREEYFQVIVEIYNLPRTTVGNYIEDAYEKLIVKNPQFAECLYKDISKVMEDIHGEGDLDLLIENGDFVIEYDDIKLTGKPTNLDDAIIFLWMKIMERFANINILKIDEQRKNFEDGFLKINDYTSAYAKKIADLNTEIRNALYPKPDGEKATPQPKQPQSPKNVSLSLCELFIDADYEKYLVPLCTIENPILRRNSDNTYTLLRGKAAVCRYFWKDLKTSALKETVKQEDISNALFKFFKFKTMPNRNSYNDSFIYKDLKAHISHNK